MIHTACTLKLLFSGKKSVENWALLDDNWSFLDEKRLFSSIRSHLTVHYLKPLGSKKGITPKMTKSNLTGRNLSAHAVYFSPCLCPGPPVPVLVRAQSELINFMLA